MRRLSPSCSLTVENMFTSNMFKLIDIFYLRIVKLSSPNINNIMLLGCALTYSTVILKPTDMRTAHICKVSCHYYRSSTTDSVSIITKAEDFV